MLSSSYLCFFSQDSSQIDLLKELMDLQKDMVVMLLSMLEGNNPQAVPFNCSCVIKISPHSIIHYIYIYKEYNNNSIMILIQYFEKKICSKQINESVHRERCEWHHW